MPNRNLNSEELKHANELLADIRKRLASYLRATLSCCFPIAAKSSKSSGMTKK